MKAKVYADFNATAPLRPESAAAIAEALAEVGNPSSVHAFGRVARARVERARAAVARLAGSAPRDVVFTSGGTEAAALALKGAGRRRLLVSAIEHDAVLAAARDGGRIPVRADGRVDLEALDGMLAEGGEPALVSVMWANNETGVVQPIREVVTIARRHGALVHSDAVQAAGKLALDFAASGLDYLSLSAHKIGGPTGIGALLVREGAPLIPQQAGGGQEQGRRSGTENLIGIAGFGAAASAAADSVEDWRRVEALRDRFEDEALAAGPGVRIFGREAPRLPNTSCISIAGMPGETQVIALDLAGIAVSAGSACSSGRVKRSHVLDAMVPGAPEAGNAIRVSLGWTNGEDDLAILVRAWRDLYNRASANMKATA